MAFPVDKWNRLDAEINRMIGEIADGVLRAMDDPKPSMYRISVWKGRRSALEDVLAQMRILERETEP